MKRKRINITAKRNITLGNERRGSKIQQLVALEKNRAGDAGTTCFACQSKDDSVGSQWPDYRK